MAKNPVSTVATPVRKEGIYFVTDDSGAPTYGKLYEGAAEGQVAAILGIHSGNFAAKIDAAGKPVTINGMPQFRAAPTSLKTRMGVSTLRNCRATVLLSETMQAKQVVGGVQLWIKIGSGQMSLDDVAANPALQKADGRFRFQTRTGTRGGTTSDGAIVTVTLPNEFLISKNIQNGSILKFRLGVSDSTVAGHVVNNKDDKGNYGLIWVDPPFQRAEGVSAAPEKDAPPPNMAD